MGENVGFLLPAWLLGAPLVLAVGDLVMTSKPDGDAPAAARAGVLTAPLKPPPRDSLRPSKSVSVDRPH